ncbi:MAG: ATP-binding protein [archaeon]
MAKGKNAPAGPEMAGKAEKPQKTENDAPRGFGADERVSVSKAGNDVDIFNDVIEGKKVEELKAALDKNEEEIMPEDEEPGEEDSEDEEEDNEDEEDKEEPEEGSTEENEKPGPTKKKKPRKEAGEEPQKPAKKKTAPIEKEPDEGDEENSEDEIADAEDETLDDDREKGNKEKKIKDGGEEEIEEGNDEETEEGYGAEEELEEFDEEGKSKIPGKDEIRKTILEKASMATGEAEPQLGEKLMFLNDKDRKSVFIGRTANIFKKYGYDAALQLGRVKEKEFENYDVYLDSLNPHVVFVCGARGSGKSYVLGVIAEELAEKNTNVGIVVVDPIGVFWSMRFPNNEEKEIEKLVEWGLEPKGLKNLKVFIPEGVRKEVPKSTYDAGFSIQPSLLTSEDWSLTFGMDRFSVSGLLLDKALKKVEKGYKETETNSKVLGKGKSYSIEDLVRCLETDSELNSRDKGYKQDSIRALVSRFEAAKDWGIFHEKGTPLGELSRQGQLTILDTSFLDDKVTALVIGILARRLLSARKISTRKEAANKFKSLDVNELLELEVPPTWLFIDEAHTLIPSGNEVTPATAGLIEYVKQGRRPGLSLVFATQQPSAINTKVLSQLDVIMTHKLIFDDDIKAVFKRTPTIMPRMYRVPNFIKTLPVGVAVTGDRREETSRAFVMAIRPRKSQHEGRDAETSGMSESMEEKQVEKLAVEMLWRDAHNGGMVDIGKARLAVDTLNSKYGASVEFDDVLKRLGAKGLVVTDECIMIEGYSHKSAVKELTSEDEDSGGEDSEEKEPSGDDEEAEGADEESGDEIAGEEGETPEESSGAVELIALPQRISEETARRTVNHIRKKTFLGLFGVGERIESIQVRYIPLLKIEFHAMSRGNEFVSRECYVDSRTCELVHFKDGNFIESKGLSQIAQMSEEEVLVLKSLQKELVLEEIMARTELDEAKVRRIMQRLMENGVAGRLVDKKTGKTLFFLKEKLDLPPNEKHELLGSLSRLPFVKVEALSVEREQFSRDEIIEGLKKLWPRIVIKKIDSVYKPVWHVVLSEDAKERDVLIDAVNGKLISK